MGAWIEITAKLKKGKNKDVAPAWGRGLKLDAKEDGADAVVSPPHGGVD